MSEDTTLVLKPEIDACSEEGGCGEEECQKCCSHDDRKCGHCIYCGHDGTEDMMAAAYDRAKDIRKYGDTV